MRVNYIVDTSIGSISISHIQDACSVFYEKHKTVADTVRMPYRDYMNFLSQLYQNQVQVLDKEKKYGIFIMIPGGMAEVGILEQEDETVVNTSSNGMVSTPNTVIAVESSLIDREFEKHILNKGQ